MRAPKIVLLAGLVAFAVAGAPAALAEAEGGVGGVPIRAQAALDTAFLSDKDLAPASVMTIVDADGNLWALPDDQAPILLYRDLGRGATVTSLAWNPVRLKLLVVRRGPALDSELRQLYGNQPEIQLHGFSSLVRVDHRSGEEAVIYPDVGPQAGLSDPRYGPDGSRVYVVEACCSYQGITVLDRDGSSWVVDSRSFPLVADDTPCYFSTMGDWGVTSEGLVVDVGPCPDDPSAGPIPGFYLVTPDSRAHAVPEGIITPPGGASLVTAEYGAVQPITGDQASPALFPIGQVTAEYNPSTGSSEVSISSSDGAPRELASVPGRAVIGRLGAPFSVSVDGRIGLTVQANDSDSVVAAWAIGPDGSVRNLSEAFPGLTTFAWGPDTVLSAASGSEIERAQAADTEGWIVTDWAVNS